MQEDARRLCGSGVGTLYFPFVIKWVAPTILGAMLGYNIVQESKGTYGGYPRWAIAVFGWLLCVLTPLSFVAYGCHRPITVIRPKEEEEEEEEENVHFAGVGGGGGGGRCTEMASLNDSKVTSDNYRDDEE